MHAPETSPGWPRFGGPLGLRNLLSAAPLAIGFIIAAIYIVMSFVARVNGSPWWDDHLLLGLAWILAGTGAAVVVRLILAAIAPERFLPRWVAVTVLILLALAAAALALWVAMMASLGAP